MSDNVEVLRYTAFAETPDGGNPAGVVLGRHNLEDHEMLAVARKVGYSETAFAVATTQREFDVRYFSPEGEVPFCGHATIATAVAIAERIGSGPLKFRTKSGLVPVDVKQEADALHATLTSVLPAIQPVTVELTVLALDALGWHVGDLASEYPVVVADAGARHLVMVCAARERLEHLRYNRQQLRALMDKHEWVTVLLAWPESEGVHVVRNAFPVGDILEDPATGAAAAAYTAYLRWLGRLPADGRLSIRQGHQLGQPSRISTEARSGDARIRVTGTARALGEQFEGLI